MPLIEDIDEATAEIETPRSFVLWGVLAAASAVLRKNVWFPKHAYRVYANIYALIVGAAGLRKGFAVWVSKELVELSQSTRLISGQNSIQGIMKELSNSETEENGGPPKFTKAQAFIVSAELANLLIEDKQAHTLLTELYDTHANEKQYTKTLKEGKTVLKEPCLTLFAASNQRLLTESLPPSAYEGGLIGRMMVVEEKKRRVINSLMERPDKMIDWPKARTEMLKIANLRGPYAFDNDDTKKYYKDWYHSFDLEGMDDNTGTSARMQDHILKVAMVLSATRRSELKITKRELDEAMDLCMLSTRSIKIVVGKQGQNSLARPTNIVVRELIESETGMVSKRDLLRRHYGDFNVEDLGKIIDTLVAANCVQVRNVQNGRESDTIYVMDEKMAEAYKQIKLGMMEG